MHLDVTDASIDSFVMRNCGVSIRESLYDTAETNFEVQVRNALGRSMRELFHDRKTTAETSNTSGVRLGNQQRERNVISAHGTPIPSEQTDDTGRPPRSQTRASKNLSRTQKKGGR